MMNDVNTTDLPPYHDQRTQYGIDDTDPKAQAVLIALLRQAPAWRKLQMVGELNAAVKGLAMSGLRDRYPTASEAVLRRHLADLLLGKELAAKAYGDWSQFDD